MIDRSKGGQSKGGETMSEQKRQYAKNPQPKKQY